MIVEPGATISIIGGGWSIGLLGKRRSRIPGRWLGVNDSYLRMSCEFGLTMDRLWLEHRFREVCETGMPFWARKAACANIEPPHFLTRFDNDHTSTAPSLVDGVLNGTNSGMCAINLALQWRPRRILLWGFDLCRSPHNGRAYWFDDYPWAKPGGATSSGKYAEWSRQYANMVALADLQGCELLNCSPASKLLGIKKINPEEVLN